MYVPRTSYTVIWSKYINWAHRKLWTALITRSHWLFNMRYRWKCVGNTQIRCHAIPCNVLMAKLNYLNICISFAIYSFSNKNNNNQYYANEVWWMQLQFRLHMVNYFNYDNSLFFHFSNVNHKYIFFQMKKKNYSHFPMFDYY